MAFSSLTVLIFSIWPVSQKTEQISFSIPDGYKGMLELTQSDQIHLGDQTTIFLKIKIDASTVEVNQVLLVSQLEMEGVSVTPRGVGRVMIDPTKPVELQWRVNSKSGGIFSGTLWLFDENSEKEKELILARPIEIESNAFLGFSFKTARLISIFGLLFGIFLYLVKFNRNPFR